MPAELVGRSARQEFPGRATLFREEWRPRAAGPALAALAALWVGAAAAQVGAPPAKAQAVPPGPAVAPAREPAVELSGSSSSVIETQRVPQPRPVLRPRVGNAVIEAGTGRLLTVGEVATISLPGVARIALGNGRLVKATVVDENQIVLLAEAAGDTTMHVWLRGGRQISYALHVQAQRYERLLADMTDFVKDTPSLRVRMVGERIVLEGRYPDSATATRVKALAASFPQVLNLTADKPMDADPLQLERMVQLDVRVIEVKKSALDQLGIKWATTANGPTFATNALGYANTPWRPEASAGFPPVSTSRPIVSYLGLATQITSALSFLEERGDAWTLAEPRLTCKSGGESKFIAGGEIPIPVAQGNGSIGVVYKQYGVVLEFKPVADGNGNIESSVLIEVSEPDSRNTNAGFAAFTTNRAESQVAIKEGEPLVIAGLLRQKVERSSDGIPGLSRIPVLSYLFGSRELRTEQTELFLVIMPRVIAPEAGVTRQGLERSQELTEDAARAAGKRLERAPSPSPLNPPNAPAATRPESEPKLPFTITSP